MKTTLHRLVGIILFACLIAPFSRGAVAANDLILTQRNAANNNNTTVYIAATADRLLQFNAASPAVPSLSLLSVSATTGGISGFGTGAGLTLHGGGTLSGASGALTLGSSVSLIGTAPLNAFNVAAGITPATELEVDSTSTSSPRGIMSAQFNTGTDGARLHLRKARGTRASPTTVVTGDNLGRVVATGYDGSNFLEMGSIIVGTEGTVASTRIPTNIQFHTATNAAPSVLTEAFRFDSSQNGTMALGNLTFSATGKGIGLHGGGTVMGASGAVTIAAGTNGGANPNSNIALTPSGTGVVSSAGTISLASGKGLALGGNTNPLSLGLSVSGNNLTIVAASTGSVVLGTAADSGIYATFAQTTTTFKSNGVQAITFDSSQNLTYTATMRVSTDTRSGTGAVSVTKDTTKLTSTGPAEAITIADGADGQIKRIVHDVDGGSMVLTPTTKTGWSTATFTNAGDTLTLIFVTTRGWMVVGNYGTVVAP